MRLISCHIENFGRLHNFDMDFDNGLNVILQENGWGKSSLAAFIRTMFFGFLGDSKRNIKENERKRFKPWQGGTYGGNISFEVNSKSFILTRLFGDKEAEDFFELRNLTTNLLSQDYSVRIGEEIFGINKDSFIRTVFIGQNDSFTYATDDVASKVGKLVDNSDDLSNYENAIKILTEKTNILNPRRATGSISKRKDEITRYERLIRESEPLQSSITELEHLLEEERTNLKSLIKEREENNLILKKISAKKADNAVKEEWERLKKEVEHRTVLVSSLRNNFNENIPSMEEIQEMLPVSQDYKAKKSEIALYMLTSEEKELLNTLENNTTNHPIRSDLNDEIQKKEEALKEKEEALLLKAKGRFPTILIFSGIFLCLVGFLYLFLIKDLPEIPTYTGIIPAAIGGFVIILGLLVNAKHKTRLQSQTDELDKLKNDIERLNEVLAREQLLTLREEENNRAKYKALSEKEDLYDKTISQFSCYKKKLEAFFARFGFDFEENADLQLLKIRDLADDYYDAVRHRKEAVDKQNAFEKEKAEILFSKFPEELPSMAEAENNSNRISAEIDKSKKNTADYEQRANSLREALDEAEENRETLMGLKKLQEEEKKLFTWTSLAKESLIKAKEAMTSRYVDPLLQSFKYYYSLITQNDTDVFHMDANTNITMDEAGLQREAALLSTGFKDLIGVALRISLADAMYTEEKPFLVMDDPFVNLDDNKLARIKSFLNTLSDKYQILYFTCSTSR